MSLERSVCDAAPAQFSGRPTLAQLSLMLTVTTLPPPVCIARR